MSATQNSRVPGLHIDQERAQDTHDGSSNNLDQVSTAEMQEQVYYPLPPGTDNEFIEMELRIELPESDGDE